MATLNDFTTALRLLGGAGAAANAEQAVRALQEPKFRELPQALMKGTTMGQSTTLQDEQVRPGADEESAPVSPPPVPEPEPSAPDSAPEPTSEPAPSDAPPPDEAPPGGPEDE